MLKAVAQGKSGSLLKRWAEKDFDLKHRPQEDLVTSAIFGNLELLSDNDRREALKIIIGDKVWKAFAPGSGPITVELWRRDLRDVDGRIVEPDVILTAGDRLAIVEVKWFSRLSEDQLGRQVRSVQAISDVNALLLLGEAPLSGAIELDRSYCDARTWRDVAKAIPRASSRPQGSLGAWMRLVADFLENTEFGHIFRGFEGLTQNDVLPAAYHFQAPGGPPWFTVSGNWISSNTYEWKGAHQ